MNDHLAARRYFVDEQLSLADIALVAYTRWADEGGFDLGRSSHVQDWVRRVEKDLGLPMRRDAFGLALAIGLAATAALAADNLDLARKLVHYNGGVSLLLRNIEAGLAAASAAPDIFRQSFDQAMTDNQQVIAAADEQIAARLCRALSHRSN